MSDEASVWADDAAPSDALKDTVPEHDGTAAIEGGDETMGDAPVEGGEETMGDAPVEAPPESGDGDADSALVTDDEPCPPGDMLLNCSDSCGPTSAECQQASCPLFVDVKWATDFPVTIRTPSHPGWSNACKSACFFGNQGAVAPAFATIVTIAIADSDYGTGKYGITAHVDPPWNVRLYSGSGEYCGPPDQPADCLISYWDNIKILLETRDPNAPARNLRIERVPNPIWGCD